MRACYCNMSYFAYRSIVYFVCEVTAEVCRRSQFDFDYSCSFLDFITDFLVISFCKLNIFNTSPHSFRWVLRLVGGSSSVTFIISQCCGKLVGCKDKLIAASLSKVDSQHPPVQKLVTPKPISLTGSRITYFKPSLKSATNSRKIHQRVDTDHQVSKF